MSGPYLHQGALMDAYKKLYMLGGPGHSRRKAAEKDFDQAASGAMSGVSQTYQDKVMRDRMATEKLRKQLEARKSQEAADQTQMDEDVRYIKGGPEAYKEFQQVQAGNAVPENPYKNELAKQAVDREAASTRIGGVYTPQGLKMAEKEANLNAQDRLMLRSMVPGPSGLGGSMPGQPMNPMQNYNVPQPSAEGVPNPEDSLSTYRGY